MKDLTEKLLPRKAEAAHDLNTPTRAVIIAGGFGTRMRPLSLSRPKHLIPLANRPLLEYQVGILREAGVTEIVFATNHLAEQIEDHFKDGSAFGVQMSYRVEPEPMDTAGAIRYAVDGLSPKRCVVFNGDTLHDFDLPSILRSHEERSAEVTLTLYPVDRPHPFGVVPLSEEKRVQAFVEPSKEQKLAAQRGEKMEGFDLINAGLYVLEAEIVDRIPLRKISIEREFYPQILQEGARVYGFEASGCWIDVGRPSQLVRASQALLSGELKLPSLIVGESESGFWQQENALIEESAQIEAGCHLGRNARIGKNAILKKNTVIGENSRVGDNTELENCIVLEEVTIGENCRLTNCILDKRTQIENDVSAQDAALGAETLLKAYSTLGQPIP